MKKANRLISLLLAVIMIVTMIPSTAITAFAEAYYNAKIEGKIADEGGNGVSQVSILVYDITENEVVDYYTTNANGYWSTGNECVSGNQYLVSYYHRDYSFSTSKFIVQATTGTLTLEDVIAVKVGEDYPESDSSKFEYEIINGSFIRITKYTGTDEMVVIPQTIDGYTTQEIGDSVFYKNLSIKRIVLPQTVEIIGNSVFQGCSSLVEVRLNGGLENISDSAFKDCISLETISLPNTITTLSASAFYNCENLTTVDFSDSITNLGNCSFYGCTRLSNLELPYAIQVIGNGAFANCTSLTSVKLPDSVTQINTRAFYGCTNLEETNYPRGWKTTENGGVNGNYRYGEVFEGCTKLTKMEIPEGVTTIPANAFRGCTNFKEIVLPSTVTEIGDCAFQGCKGLENIELPNGLLKIGGSAFNDCDGFTELELPDSITNIEPRAFYGCDNLENVNYPMGWTTCESGGVDGNWRYGEVFANCVKLTKIVLPEGVTVIPANAFRGCNNLTEITLPSTLITIGGAAFSGCSGLASIELPDGLKTIEHRAFEECDGLTEIVIPDSVTTILPRAFYNCDKLSKVGYPKGLTACTPGPFEGNWLYGQIFNGCNNLTSITIPEGVTALPDYVFYECTNFAEIKLSSTLTTIGGAAFEGCTGLTSISLPDGLQKIGVRAFQNCDGLISVQIPDSVTTLLPRAFYSCDSLRSINYPASWNNCEPTVFNSNYYYGQVFAECLRLKTITVPDSVTAIPDYAFSNSPFRSILLPDTLKTIGKEAFYNCSELRTLDCTFKNLTTVAEQAFRNCQKLRTITLLGDASIGRNAFTGCSVLTIYCSEYSDTTVYFIDEGIKFKQISESKPTDNEVIDIDKCSYTTSFSSVGNGGNVSIVCDYAILTDAYTNLSDKKLSIKIPNGSTLVTKSLYYNGELCTSFTENNGNLIIPITSQEGKVTFSIKMTEDVDIVSYAIITYQKDNNSAYEIIGILNEDIPTISVMTPTVSNVSTVVVSGIAPSNTEVNVYIDNVLIKSVQSNKLGSYNATIALPDVKDGYVYTIKASAIDKNGEEVYATTRVEYSSGTPVMTAFELIYNGKTYDLMSSAKPNISFSSAYKPHFEITFTNPENVKEVFVTSDRNNVTKKLEAEWDETKQAFVAEGYFDPNDHGYVPGKLNVYYSEEGSMTDNTDNISMDDESYNEIFNNATAEVITDTETACEIKVTFEDGSVSTVGSQVFGWEDGIRDMFGEDADEVLGAVTPVTTYSLRTRSISTAGDVLLKFLKDSGKTAIKTVSADGIEYVYYQEWENGDLITYVVDVAKGSVTKAFFKDICPAVTTWLLEENSYGYVDDAVGGFVWSNLYGGYQAVNGYWEDRENLNAIRDSIAASGRTDAEKEHAYALVDEYQKQAKMIAVCKGLCTFVDTAITLSGVGTFTPHGLLLKGSLFIVKDVLLDMWEEELDANIKYLQGNADDSSVNWAIDPSGYVYEGVTSNRIPDVKVTVSYIPYDETDDNFWDSPKMENALIWDASEWDQVNPLYTDADGKYAWDVPEGWWQVKYEKEGYETTFSEWLPVPPPQTEVNIGLTSTTTPTVESVEVNDGSVVITFSQYIDPETFTGVVLKDADGNNIEYTVEYSKDETDLDGNVFAKVFTLNIATGTAVASIEVPETITNYAGKAITPYDETFGEEVLYGDVTGDGVVNNKDVTFLRRYLIGGWDVTIDTVAADVNKDGSINNKDVTLLRRYLIGGWNVTLG